jgi:hypothetical protein
MDNFSWTANGDGFFVAARNGQDALILHVALNGDTRIVLHETGAFGLMAASSPDSRFLALTRWRVSNNIWMIDNF